MLEGKRVSAITIQKILNDHDLGTRYDRWLARLRRGQRLRPGQPHDRRAADVLRASGDRNRRRSLADERLHPPLAAPVLCGEPAGA